MRIEITEGGGEEHLGSIQLDHTLHGFLDLDGLRHFFFIEGLHPVELGDRRFSLEMCLIVPVVVSRTHKNKTHLDLVRCAPGLTDPFQVAQHAQRAGSRSPLHYLASRQFA